MLISVQVFDQYDMDTKRRNRQYFPSENLVIELLLPSGLVWAVYQIPHEVKNHEEQIPKRNLIDFGGTQGQRIFIREIEDLDGDIETRKKH